MAEDVEVYCCEGGDGGGLGDYVVGKKEGKGIRVSINILCVIVGVEQRNHIPCTRQTSPLMLAKANLLHPDEDDDDEDGASEDIFMLFICTACGDETAAIADLIWFEWNVDPVVVVVISQEGSREEAMRATQGSPYLKKKKRRIARLIVSRVG